MDVLGEFHEDPLPPSTVDVRRAVRTGRRRRHRRTGVAAIGLVAVVAAGVAIGPQLPRLLADNAGGPLGSPSGPLACEGSNPLPDPPPAEAPAGQAPTAFPVLRRLVDLSAVTGYRLQQYTTSRHWQRLELADPTGASLIEVIVLPLGGHPTFATDPGAAPTVVDPTTGTATDPVAGHPAWWLPGRQGLAQYEVTRLGWQWAPGAWAFVAGMDTSVQDGPTGPPALSAEQLAALRVVTRSVAEKLAIGRGPSVTSPFTMAVPACTRLVATALLSSTASGDRPFTRFSLMFATDAFDDDNPLLGRGGGPTITVAADSVATPADKPGSATQTVDGHPAAGEGDVLVVHGVDGFALELNTPGGPSEGAALYRTVHVIPGAHEDRSLWTDKPLES